LKSRGEERKQILAIFPFEEVKGLRVEEYKRSEFVGGGGVSAGHEPSRSSAEAAEASERRGKRGEARVERAGAVASSGFIRTLLEALWRWRRPTGWRRQQILGAAGAPLSVQLFSGDSRVIPRRVIGANAVYLDLDCL